MKKRLTLILVACLALSWAGYAKTIGFVCMHNPDIPAGAAELTTALETELFELCFDHGCIVTSAERNAETSAQYADTNALIKPFDSSIDYVVAVYCEYRQSTERVAKNSEYAIQWKKLQWKIIDFASKRIMFENVVDPEKIPEPELKQKVKAAGKTIGDSILSSL